MEMEGEQYPFQIAYFHLKFNKYEEEPDFCLMQSRVLRQSEAMQKCIAFLNYIFNIFLIKNFYFVKRFSF